MKYHKLNLIYVLWSSLLQTCFFLQNRPSADPLSCAATTLCCSNAINLRKQDKKRIQWTVDHIYDVPHDGEAHFYWLLASYINPPPPPPHPSTNWRQKFSHDICSSTPLPPFNVSIHCEHLGLLLYLDSLHVRDQYMVSSMIGEADNVTA